MQKVEQEERDLLTSSGTAIEELLQVEKKVQALTEEPHETVKANSQVEITNESITGNLEHRDGEQFPILPTLNEIDGEKISSSSQLHNGRGMTNGVNREESNTHLIAEEGLRSQEVEITGASVQGTQPNAEESRDLHEDEAIRVVQDDTMMAPQEATSAQTPGIEDHLDATQGILQEVEITVTGASVPGTQPNVEESRDLNKDEAICAVQEDTIMESQEATSAQTTGIEDHLNAAQDSQDAEMLPFSVIERYETTKEVESLSEHTGNVSAETECGKENRETSEGNPQDAERVIQSTNIDNETTKEVEIPPDLAENFSIGMESVADNCEKEGNFEDHTTLLHSAIPEDEIIEKVESLSEHTSIVSVETECSSDHTKMSKENSQDAEKIFHSVDVQDENIEKAGNSPDFTRNVSIDTEDGSNYIEATKEEISDDIEMNTLGAEPGEISCEVKSTDDGKEKEILESESSHLGSANVAVSSTVNYPNKSEKEEVENSSHEEQVSSPMISAFTGEILLKDVGPEKVQETDAHSGTIFEKEEAETEDTSEPALVKEVPDMVPIVAKENQAEVEKQNLFLEDVATENGTESAMGNAQEMPEPSSMDLVIEKRETLGNESQEQVPVELLAGEGIHDEVSKALTETNIEVEEPVKPEISNTKKDLEALLPKSEPGKENRSEFLQEASGPLEKIDSCQHSERAISVQEQRLTELLEGDLCEEKDSTSNASESKADNSVQEVRII